MADIKLFVCCHRLEQRVPNHPLLVPIQVGTVLADSRFPHFLHDDIGENISEKNHSYCELTAQYWAWKNTVADYYGFFHYRRYLYPDTMACNPYKIMGQPELTEIGFQGFPSLIEQYDLLAPKGENMFMSVWDHYASSPYHHIKDLQLAEQIVLKIYPEMADALHQYFSGTICYFGNIYIMRRSVFTNYCKWLFSVLDEFDKQCDTRGYSTAELRVDGYIAERLFGVYYTYFREELKVVELPRVHFIPNTFERLEKKLLYFLLPPGSKRRSWCKKLRTR